jgi:hypothetical protein
MGDFPDWLSPLLVKEFRQGLRGKSFEWTFIALHLGMLLTVASGLTRQQRGGDASFVGGFFWSLMIVVLVLGVPIRGMLDLAEEKRTRNVELMTSAGVSGVGLAFGKWISLMMQGLLLVVSLLPYFGMRYFAGGVDLVADAKVLGLVFLISGVLTAGGLASGGLGGLARLKAAGIIAFCTMMTSGWLLSLQFQPAQMAALNRMGLGWLAIIGTAVGAMVVLLRLAGDALGGVGENGAKMARGVLLVGWLLVVAAIANHFRGGRRAVPDEWVVILFVWVGVTALVFFWFLGPGRELRSVHLRGMRGRGGLGQWTGALFSPHWVGSVWLPLLAFAGLLVFVDWEAAVKLILGTLELRGRSGWIGVANRDVEPFVRVLQFLTLFPAGVVVWRLFCGRVKDGRTAFFLMLVAGGLAASVFGAVAKLGEGSGSLVLPLIPPASIWVSAMEGGDEILRTGSWLVASLVAFLLYEGLAIWLAVRWWRRQPAWIAFLERERGPGGSR